LDNYLSSMRPEATGSPESGIVAVFNYGRGREGLIPLWTGEGDLPTPEFIHRAATEGLIAGDTFYTWQRGVPKLRQALADYHQRVYGKSMPAERFFITGSGMQAIQIAIQAIAGSGDEVIVPSPIWPNITAALGIMGAKPVMVAMDFSPNGWSLDLEKLASSITDKTKALFVNSPGNPTGWMADLDMLRDILALARKHGLWIIADEVYGRFVYNGDRAPSFYDIAKDDDRIIYVNTFSKNWAMTGWRVGWISAPPELGQIFENLIQYSTSGVAGFMQRGATAALDEGESFFLEQREKARQSRDILVDALNSTGKARFAVPQGALYLFFSVEGEPDGEELAKRLVDEANVGLAPGEAFGPGAQGFLRACFLRDSDQIKVAAERMAECLRPS